MTANKALIPPRTVYAKSTLIQMLNPPPLSVAKPDDMSITTRGPSSTGQVINSPSDRATTGILGLDQILNGGLPRNHIYLIDGKPGTGKTTMALQFLLEGVQIGEKGLYVTRSETREELEQVAGTHGWTLRGIEIFELASERPDEAAEGYTLFHPAEVELQQTMDSVLARIEDIDP